MTENRAEVDSLPKLACLVPELYITAWCCYWQLLSACLWEASLVRRSTGRLDAVSNYPARTARCHFGKHTDV